MNRRYIDFVPTKPGQRAVKRGQEAERVVHVRVPKAPVGNATRVKKVVKRTRVVASNSVSVPEAEHSHMGARVATREPALGVVEDLNTKFVKTTVEKRPLSRQSADKLMEAKAQRVKSRKIERAVSAPVEKPVEKSDKKGASSVYRAPRTPFINQDKVVKRPLSKNVYQKKVIVPKEEPKGPVAIISKPEKEAHMGIVLTIIITIVLGAAAGTVAFLLLPK